MAEETYRQMFETYVYDYLIKRNMHQTAEIFKNEANLQLHPDAIAVDDAPQGFLRDWWEMCYDFDYFRAWVHSNETQRLETTQGWNTSQAEMCSMNEQAMNQLPYNFPPTFSIGSNSMQSHVTDEVAPLFLQSSYGEVSAELLQLVLPPFNQEVQGQFSQLFLPSPHQEELLRSTMRTVNPANASVQKVEPLVQNTTKVENTAFDEEPDPVIENLLNSFWLFEQDQPELFDNANLGESSRNMENLLACGEGNTGLNDIAGCTSPALQDDDNKSETSDCSSNFRIVTTDGDALMVDKLESDKER